MINVIRGIIYFMVFVLLQILVLNNIHFFRMAIPFLYLYFIIKLPVGTSKSAVIFFSFLLGLVIDVFSNTTGMHAAACTLAGFSRDFLINIYMGKDLPYGTYPSYRSFGYGGFIKYTVTLVLIHHITLFMIESLTIFDPVFLALRILTSVALSSLLICIVEAFNIESEKIAE